MQFLLHTQTLQGCGMAGAKTKLPEPHNNLCVKLGLKLPGTRSGGVSRIPPDEDGLLQSRWADVFYCDMVDGCLGMNFNSKAWEEFPTDSRRMIAENANHLAYSICGFTKQHLTEVQHPSSIIVRVNGVTAKTKGGNVKVRKQATAWCLVVATAQKPGMFEAVMKAATEFGLQNAFKLCIKACDSLSVFNDMTGGKAERPKPHYKLPGTRIPLAKDVNEDGLLRSLWADVFYYDMVDGNPDGCLCMNLNSEAWEEFPIDSRRMIAENANSLAYYICGFTNKEHLMELNNSIIVQVDGITAKTKGGNVKVRKQASAWCRWL